MTIHARVLPLVLLAALFALPAPSAGARVAEEPGPAAAVAPSPLAGIRPRPRPKVDVPAAHLSRALFSMRQGDYSTALAAAGKAGPVARDIIEWHRLRAGGGRFDEVVDFLERRPDWPGLAYLKFRSEGSVPFGAREREVTAFFRDNPPQTGAGSVALVAALARLDDRAGAEAAVVRAWRTQTIGEGGEQVLLENYGELLRPHHVARLDMLLWENQRSAAERMYPLVSKGHKAAAEARLALRADRGGVDALVEAVPEALQDDPGLLFERFQWRARKGRNDDALEIALAREGTVEALGRPEMWAGWRRGLARAEMRGGDPETAYRLASAHGLTEGSNFADLEWLSGYLALTYLDDPEAALRHFQRFRAAVGTPISLGRAGYWEGRAWEALGNTEAAQTAYEFGGVWQTSFYGLLAAEKAGLPTDPSLAGADIGPDWRGTSFAASSVLEAALLLQRAGERSLAERFFTHLAESLDEREAGALGDLALELDEPHIAVMVGKRAADRALVLPRPYYPVVDLGAEVETVEPALALAIARRESEFDIVVQSGVGARGLMQLMPATAEEVSRSLGLDYSARRLVEDPVYNATLGTTYLSWLMDEFRGNPIYVAGAYNAGPSRIRRWVGDNGDPAGGSDVEAMIDWIEHIPFTETRNYVMRVAESLPVYRARIAGAPDEQPFSDLILQSLQGAGN